jgi:peptide/nickel transport system substrate-binding protein
MLGALHHVRLAMPAGEEAVGRARPESSVAPPAKAAAALGRTRWAFRWLIAAFLLLTGAGAAAARDQLVIGITQYPGNLNPDIESMAAKAYVLGMTQRPLTVYDQSWHLVCMLCTMLPTFENGRAVREKAPDGKEGVALTYTLEPHATWGDGVPVTTKDVLFTWEVGRNPQSGITNAELYRRIWKIEAVDDKTFVVHDDKLDFDYNAINDFRVLPEHLERRVFEADPAAWRNRTLFDADPTNPGLAFGPYRIVGIVPGSSITLERNPTWWGERPAFDRIVVKAIESTASLEANLLSGDVDMTDGALGLSIDQAIAFAKRHADRFRVVFKPGLFYEHVDLMLGNPILADRRVRQALLYGADRAAISQRLFDGRQPVAATFVHPLDWVHTNDVQHYPYDPAKAAALLDAAGWKKGAGGLRRDARGDVMRLELMTTAGDRSRELVEQVLQSQWRQLGVDVQIKNQPARVLFGQTLTRRSFTGMAMFAWISSPENPPRSTLRSDEIPSAANGWTGQNYGGYSNPEMDRLIDAIEVELDRDKRQALWARLQQLYAEDLPALPLFFRAEPHIWPLWLEGVEPTGQMAPTTLWIERWRDAGPAG